jgi:hypothetical protein
VDDDGHQRILKDHVAALMEHFDSVIILATHTDREEDQTTAHHHSGGSWAANFGCVRRFLIAEEAKFRRAAERSYDRDFADDEED